MSETLSQDPELSTAGYTNLATTYPPTPATPSSTVQDGPPGANLPPFSTFSTDMDSATGFNTDRLFTDTRLLDISNWDYYTEARLLDRSENGLSIISSQPQYRPWESKSAEQSAGFTSTTPVNTFADAFSAQQNGVSKLPSFQSQFQSFNETTTGTTGNGGEPTLTTLTNLTPVSPNSSSSPGSHSLTTLNSNFHTLSAVNPRSYPLVPAPIQAREIPSIQQQFLDERHIQLYTHPTNLTNLNTGIFPQNGTIIQNSPLISSPTVVTVLKSEADLKLTANLTAIHHQDPGLKLQNVGLHPTQFQNPISTMVDNGIYNGLDKKLNGIGVTMSPTRNDFRKKERRKMRASSLESSAESDGASSNMDIGGSENSGQVAAVSSTAGFKHHSLNSASGNGGGGVEMEEITGGNVDKQVKKKRKRCGECIGCQRKDNCGDCAPCRNDKSHQICKQRRCEKLTEKKNLYGEASYLRGESRRGRGKGRGAGSYRGRKPSGPMSGISSGPTSGMTPESNGNVTILSNQQQSARPSPQPAPVPPPVHMLKTEQQTLPVQQQSPMAPMPFYADPNRFPAPVWQTDPTQAWPQGQFIQQIPTATQPTLDTYQQYPNGIYQATYQQPAFETNTFYTTGPVQVLTNTRPPSTPNQQSQLTPRPNSNYSHTPSPAPTSQTSSNRTQQYSDYNTQNQNFVSPATTPSGNTTENSGNISRPSSVNSTISNPANNQNFNQQQQQQSNNTNFTAATSSNFSPGSNSNYSTGTNSGNAKPGYPQVNSSPQLVSHNSSGYPGNGQYSGTSHEQHQQQQQQVLWQNETWEQHNQQQESVGKEYDNHHINYENHINDTHQPTRDNTEFSQADRVNLNTRIKTMILSKHQQIDEEEETNDKKLEQQQQQSNNSAGHFLWYSHHHHSIDKSDDGGSLKPLQTILKFKIKTDNLIIESNYNTTSSENEILQYDYFHPDQVPQQKFYATHLVGCFIKMNNLCHDLENKTGVIGKAIKIQTILPTGKEGKTDQEYSKTKRIIGRSNLHKKLKMVEHSSIYSVFIIVFILQIYVFLYTNNTLSKYGIETAYKNLESNTKQQKSNVCQDDCSAYYSFGNSCKYAHIEHVLRKNQLMKLEEEILKKSFQIHPKIFEGKLRTTVNAIDWDWDHLEDHFQMLLLYVLIFVLMLIMIYTFLSMDVL